MVFHEPCHLLNVGLTGFLLLFAQFLTVVAPVATRQLASSLQGLDALVGRHIDGVVVGVEERHVRTAAGIDVAAGGVLYLEDAADVHQLLELRELLVGGEHVVHGLART